MSKKLIYISDGTWFKKGTECELITNLENGSGIFKGIHIIKNKIEAKNYNKKIGDEIEDEELCSMDEFKKYEEIDDMTYFKNKLAVAIKENNEYLIKRYTNIINNLEESVIIFKV